MSDAWQQGRSENTPPGSEPYPGFANMHAEYYRQYRQNQQHQMQQASAPPLLKSMFQFWNPRYYPEPLPGISPEKHEEIKAEIRKKRKVFYQAVAIFLIAMGGMVYRLFT